jgi:tRNA dimethylallyltransferase
VQAAHVKLVAIFGPTAVGKTGVAIELAEQLRARGEDPVAISCDALQVYRGLEALTGAPTAAERQSLQHRLVGIAEVTDEFSAGRFAELAREQIDECRVDGRRAIVVGGTGLYLRAALSGLELRPPVPAGVRERVEAEIAVRGPQALHGELEPALAATVHPRDRKRIARAVELQRAGLEPPPRDGGELWTARLRRPTLLVGLVCDRAALDARIDTRVDAIVAAGAAEEVRRAVAGGASRTARAALGFGELLRGDVEAMKREHRRYARRQLTWMRRMQGVHLIDRTGRSDDEVAREIVGLLDENGAYQSP